MRRTTIKVLSTTGAAAALFLAAGSASAQSSTDLGAEGQFIISAERLMPLFSYQSYKTSADDNNSNTDSAVNISLLTSNPHQVTFYNVPRLALDYVVIPNLTVGGSAFISFDLSSSHDTKVNGTTVSADQGKVTFWGIAPRAGYILEITDMFAFWPRAGLTYTHYSVSSTVPNPTGPGSRDVSDSVGQLALNLEPMFTFTPFNHFGIVGGPVIDIPLTGSATTERSVASTTQTTSVDATQFHLGATVGLLGYF
jgi:hypothetical protein